MSTSAGYYHVDQGAMLFMGKQQAIVYWQKSACVPWQSPGRSGLEREAFGAALCRQAVRALGTLRSVDASSACPPDE